MYTYEKQEGKAKVKISLTNEEFQNYVQKAYEENKGRYNVQGFRKGKAPRKVIEKMYGETVFYDDAMDKAFGDEYMNFLRSETDLDIIDNPTVKIDKFDETGIEFSAEAPLSPEVKLGAYTGVEVTKNKAQVKNEDVEEELKKIQERQARFVDVSDDETKMGDFVKIDFVGYVDGKEFEGGKAENYKLELGSKSFIDTFEEQLVGLKTGDQKEVNVTFPAEYGVEDLRAKPAVFKVTVEGIERKELPELNDKFAQDCSEFETLEDYKKDIEKRLQKQLENKVERELENTLIEKIVQGSETDVPECLVNRQLDMFLRDFEMRLGYQGIKLEDYASYANTTVEEIKESRRDTAKQAVKTRLVLEEIIKKEALTVSEEELNEKLSEMADRYKKSLEDYKKSIGDKELAYFENDILMTKLIKFLKENNTIK